jgi:NADPH-dependent F420 reductase
MTDSIGLVGGTGAEGRGLAARFALAGLEATIGSRSAERGEEAARELSSLTGRPIRGGTNADAASADIVVITLPYAGLEETLAPLAPLIGNRVVISTVNALVFSRQRVSLLDVADGCAAQEIQRLLPSARVTGAFHILSARHLLELSHVVEGDVIVCGDDAEAVERTIALAELIEDVRGVNGGPLANCRYVEGLTALLVNINRINKAETNVRIVGL